MTNARLAIALFGFVLLAACGKPEGERRIDEVIIDPIEETSVQVCNSSEPCVVELNEAGDDDGFN